MNKLTNNDRLDAILGHYHHIDQNDQNDRNELCLNIQ